MCIDTESKLYDSKNGPRQSQWCWEIENGQLGVGFDSLEVHNDFSRMNGEARLPKI